MCDMTKQELYEKKKNSMYFNKTLELIPRDLLYTEYIEKDRLKEDLLKDFHITVETFECLCIHYNIVKDVKSKKSLGQKERFKKEFEDKTKHIDLEELKHLYLDLNYSYTYLLEKYQINGNTLDRILRENNLKKSKKQSAIIVLENKYKKAGSKTEYDKQVYETTKKNIQARGTTLDQYYDSIRLKCQQAWKDLPEDKKIERRKKIAVNSELSSLEKRFKEFLDNNNFEYDQHHVLSNDKWTHEFDFAIYKDSELNTLVDCDGQYYHGYLDDVNGTSVNNYSDDYRPLLVPEGVRFLVCVETDEESAYKELLRLIDLDYEEYLEDIFESCRATEFPYPVVCDKTIHDSYRSLVRADITKFSNNARYGMKVVDKFHRSVWKANRKGYRSPYEAWQDDQLLTKCIKNRIVYKGTKLDPSRVLRGLSVARVAPKVSVFNPNLAKYLVEKYLSEFDTVFDPCSGYSGRLLGTCAAGKHYIGQDINVTTVKESQQIIDYLDLNATVSCIDSLATTGRYDCLFTCSPYSDKERWGTDIPNMTCDEWIDSIISKYACKRYLFVVDQTEKYKDYVVETITNKSHLNTNHELVICIDK